MIEMYWSLFQIEKVVLEENSTLINKSNLHFLNEVKIENLNAKQFMMFKQLVCLAKMFSDS